VVSGSASGVVKQRQSKIYINEKLIYNKMFNLALRRSERALISFTYA